MTTLAVCSNGAIAALASDIQGTFIDGSLRVQKIFPFRDYTLGFSGSDTIPNLLRYGEDFFGDVPLTPARFFSKLRTYMRNQDLGSAVDGVWNSGSSIILVEHPESIWLAMGNLVPRRLDVDTSPYYSFGSGSHFAMGAMAFMEARHPGRDRDPPAYVEAAVRCAAVHDEGTSIRMAPGDLDIVRVLTNTPTPNKEQT